MPSPSLYENEEEFLKYCIPKVLEEGIAEDHTQAAAICHSMWEKNKGIEFPINWRACIETHDAVAFLKAVRRDLP